MSGQILKPFVIERLAAQLERPVDHADNVRASLHLLDWLGCALAGKETDTGRSFLTMDRETPSARAFVWGALGNILEMDDVDKRAILHCGPSIIPAALAAAGPDDGRKLLNSIVRGYEATIRLGRATGPGHYALWHSTATCGPIGASVAAAVMMDAESEGLARAMSLGVSQASGFWQTRHEAKSAGKQLHTAHAARAGVDAARLAATGLTGPLGILEGVQGFFAAMCPDGAPEAVMTDYGDGWLIHQVSFKPWPACRHAHPAIDAALLAVRAGDADEEIEAVHVSTYPDALKFCDRAAPSSVVEAKFSLQHSVAVALIKGAPSLADFHAEAITDPAVSAMRERVTVRAEEPYASAYPGRFGAGVRIRTSSGRESVHIAPDALGDPENPLDDAGIRKKALDLMRASGLSEDAAAGLADATLALPDGGSLMLLLEALP